jgi:hypothetical protein
MTIASPSSLATDTDPASIAVDADAGDDRNERTPIQQGNHFPFFTHSAPIGNRIVGRFWAHENDNGEEDEISTPTTEDLIAAASREGFSMDELIHADKEQQDAEKVGFPSPTSSDFRCPLATKIIKVVARNGALKHRVKLWQGPLPKARVSLPKMLGDAVIKNAWIRVRGGQTIPVSFKMVLPSMADGTSSSPTLTQTSKRNMNTEPWPSLLEIRSLQTTQERTTSLSPDSVTFGSNLTGHWSRDLNFEKDGI